MNPNDVKPGEKMTVNGEEMEVVKVTNLAEAAAKVPTEVTAIESAAHTVEESKATPAEAAWEQLVRGVISRAKGIDPDKVTLPNGTTGQYIKYAMDPSGQYFSPGKGHGRRRTRWTSQKAEIARLYNALLSAGLTAAFKAAQAEADKNSTPENKVEPKPITADKLRDIQQWAELKAPEVYYARIDGGRKKAARKRQKMARRVGFGLVAGNRAKNIFSAA